MKPYYEEPGITIYCGDCREILPTLDPVDLVLTDPPYGINGGRGGGARARQKGAYKGCFTDKEDKREYIASVVVPVVASLISVSGAVIVTPGAKNIHLYPPADSFGCFYCPAATGFQRWGNSDAHPILYYGVSPFQGRVPGPCSYVLTDTRTHKGHPCSKPLSLWKKILLRGCIEKNLVLDPFMGVGTTLLASKQTNRRAIGIEIEEKYCEIAVKRLRQEVFNFD